MPLPRLLPRERVVAEAEAVDIEGGPDPCPRDVDCGEDRGHRGCYRVDRIALRLHRHHPRGNPRAALHRHTAIRNDNNYTQNRNIRALCTRQLSILSFKGIAYRSSYNIYLSRFDSRMLNYIGQLNILLFAKNLS